MEKQLVLIIKQKDDQDLWVKIRNLLWHSSKKDFSNMEERVYVIEEETENTIRFRKLKERER